jgi:hypothetical protein
MKKFILITLILAIAIAGWYAYYEYNRKNKDLKSETADISIAAPSLIAAFEKDSSAANKMYTDKILAVNGNVKKIDAEGNPVIIFLGTPGQMSSVKCSMDSLHAADYKAVKEGSSIIVKGKCSGGETTDLFGTDVTLNYCVIQDKK